MLHAPRSRSHPSLCFPLARSRVCAEAAPRPPRAPFCARVSPQVGAELSTHLVSHAPVFRAMPRTINTSTPESCSECHRKHRDRSPAPNSDAALLIITRYPVPGPSHPPPALRAWLPSTTNAPRPLTGLYLKANQQNYRRSCAGSRLTLHLPPQWSTGYCHPFIPFRRRITTPVRSSIPQAPNEKRRSGKRSQVSSCIRSTISRAPAPAPSSSLPSRLRPAFQTHRRACSLPDLDPTPKSKWSPPAYRAAVHREVLSRARTVPRCVRKSPGQPSPMCIALVVDECMGIALLEPCLAHAAKTRHLPAPC
ncbi:hypothetical protein DFH06DRAFT_1318148 [Mycena polygramma]|nr:hypothetical protein DFH06DRAFT_1318147 [Mycena polygramma]KAJ7676008.1 hypothetical protein DFH06DRAFT_1318148 [Mycena polygramma]